MQDKQTLRFVADDSDIGDRLDVYLCQQKNEFSRSFFQRLIASDMVKVNGQVMKKASYSVRSGDEIDVMFPEPVKLDLEPENIPLDIVYEDKDLAVINKPQGMVVHPACGNYSGTLVNALLWHCKDLSGINSALRPGIVHRLDKDTSGLIVIAKNDVAHISLAQQIKEKSAHRQYVALVDNCFNTTEGMIETGYGRNPNDRLKMAVFPLPSPNVDSNIRYARTDYTVLEQFKGTDNYALVQCKLYTGRTHQIRVHMAYIKHPVVGDPVYGSKKQKFALNGQLLHAQKLSFVHPTTGQFVEFEAPLPNYFQNVVEKLRKQQSI